jgi:hypothetical protein
MHNRKRNDILYAIGLFVLASVAGLWSWNTLAELFNLPQAQYRHALAACFLLLILRWCLAPGRGAVRRRFGGAGKSAHH